MWCDCCPTETASLDEYKIFTVSGSVARSNHRRIQLILISINFTDHTEVHSGSLCGRCALRWHLQCREIPQIDRMNNRRRHIASIGIIIIIFDIQYAQKEYMHKVRTYEAPRHYWHTYLYLESIWNCTFSVSSETVVLVRIRCVRLLRSILNPEVHQHDRVHWNWFSSNAPTTHIQWAYHHAHACTKWNTINTNLMQFLPLFRFISFHAAHFNLTSNSIYTKRTWK